MNKEQINQLLKKGHLASPDLDITDLDLELLDSVLVITNDTIQIAKREAGINFSDLERARVFFEKHIHRELYEKFSKGSLVECAPARIISSYEESPKESKVEDLVSNLNSKFRQIRNILMGRRELRSAVSVNKVKQKNDGEKVCIIGMVNAKNETKLGHITIDLEDQSGSVTCIIRKNDKENFPNASDITLDEVIAIEGSVAKGAIFVDKIYFPDVPADLEFKKSPDLAFAAFISDVHIGSKQFMNVEFMRFIKWIRQEAGDDKQREIASKVKYIFFIGDNVDGVGIYPNQEKELSELDVYLQYKLFCEYIAMIPKHIRIIICPGNHDASRLSEPQPALKEDIVPELYKMSNVTLVSNPAMVNIHSSDEFSGFDVLIYHGYSFDYYLANIDRLRVSGGYDRPDLLMKYLLKKRHLAPTYASTLNIWDPNFDPLVIDKVPDIFAAGHLHKIAFSQYAHVTLLCCSCFQGQTSFQQRMALIPDPARVNVINLKTREIKVMKFG